MRKVIENAAAIWVYFCWLISLYMDSVHNAWFMGILSIIGCLSGVYWFYKTNTTKEYDI